MVNQTFRQRNIILFLILVCLFSFGTYVHDNLKLIKDNCFVDFGNYYINAYLMRNGYNYLDLNAQKREQLMLDNNLMSRPVLDKLLMYSRNWGHPIPLIPIVPFTYLKYKHAAAAWLLLNNILLFLSLVIIIYIAAGRLSFSVFTLSAMIMVFNFAPLTENISVGNTNLLILFFIAVAALFIKEDKPVLVGIMLAVATIFKHQYGLLLLFFLWKRNFSVILSAFATAIGLQCLSILYAGISLNTAYLETISSVLLNINKGTRIAGGLYNQATDLFNLSIDSFFYRLFSVTGAGPKFTLVKTAILLLDLILLSYTFFVTRLKREFSDPILMIEFSIVLTLTLIVSPVVHETYYVVLFLPVLLYWHNLINFEKQLSFWIIFISAFLAISLKYSLNQFEYFHYGFPSLLFKTKLYGTALFFLLGVKILRYEKHKKRALNNQAL